MGNKIHDMTHLKIPCSFVSRNADKV